MTHRHVVSFSGGAGSWMTARRVAEQYGTENLTLLTADTNTEAPDWLPFVYACHEDVGGELVILDNGGRNIWDVFYEARFMGNSRVDICSRMLKREPLRKWLEDNCDPADTTIYLGFDWTEEHRLHRARPHWEPWTVESPLCDPPYLQKAEILFELEAAGIQQPELYTKGYSHNNCGGACVKAGQAQWAKLLRDYPERYAYHEQQEYEFRDFIEKDVSILRDRRGGETKPLTLEDFRLRLIEESEDYDHADWGACSCMESSEEE